LIDVEIARVDLIVSNPGTRALLVAYRYVIARSLGVEPAGSTGTAAALMTFVNALPPEARFFFDP